MAVLANVAAALNGAAAVYSAVHSHLAAGSLLLSQGVQKHTGLAAEVARCLAILCSSEVRVHYTAQCVRASLTLQSFCLSACRSRALQKHDAPRKCNLQLPWHVVHIRTF